MKITIIAFATGLNLTFLFEMMCFAFLHTTDAGTQEVADFQNYRSAMLRFVWMQSDFFFYFFLRSCVSATDFLFENKIICEVHTRCAHYLLSTSISILVQL